MSVASEFILKRWGRKLGFMAAVLVGLSGASLGTYAIFAGSFVLINVATRLYGIFNGLVSYYRFAAVQAAWLKSWALTPQERGEVAIAHVITTPNRLPRNTSTRFTIFLTPNPEATESPALRRVQQENSGLH